MLEARDQLREAVDGVGLHAEHLAHLAHGQPRAVGDHHRRHGGAARAVLREDVLDDLLARAARGQVEVDVGPLAALLREEALEEQLHADRVDGGDAQGVTHSAVGGGAAALGEDVLLRREARDVVDDEEVARQVELLDHGELALELGARPLGKGRAVALARAAEGQVPEERGLGLAAGNGELWKAVAEVPEGEGAALGDLGAGADPLGPVGEARGHLARPAQVPLGVGCEPASGAVEGGSKAQAGEGVEQAPTLGPRVRDVVGGDDGNPLRLRQGRRPAALGLGGAVEVAGDVDPQAPAPEGGEGAVEERGRERAVAARERDEPPGVLVDLLPRDEGFSLGRLRMADCEEPAEIAVAPPRLDEQEQALRRSVATSAPTMGRMPAASAARWKRGAP